MASIETPPYHDRTADDAEHNSLLGDEISEHLAMIESSQDALAPYKKFATYSTIASLALGLSALGLEHGASPAEEQKRHDTFMRSIDHDGRYQVISADKGLVFEVSIDDGAIIRFEPDPKWGDNISTVLKLDEEATKAFVNQVILYDGDPEIGSWTGLTLSELHKQSQLSEVTDDTITPLRSDNLVWIRSDSTKITNVPVEIASYTDDKTDE